MGLGLSHGAGAESLVAIPSEHGFRNPKAVCAPLIVEAEPLSPLSWLPLSFPLLIPVIVVVESS